MEDLIRVNSQCVRFVTRLDGRDKICRATAYGSEFILWLLSMSGREALKKWIQSITKMKTGVGIARKCFRVGAPLKDLDAVANIKETGTPATLKTLMHCFNSVYYSLDTVELLSIFEFLPYDPKKIKKMRYRFWVVKTILNIALSFIVLRKAAAAVRFLQDKLSKGGDTAALAEDLQAKKAALSKAQVTEWGQRNIGPHGMGLSGAIGSLVGARLIWAECAAKIKKD